MCGADEKRIKQRIVCLINHSNWLAIHSQASSPPLTYPTIRRNPGAVNGHGVRYVTLPIGKPGAPIIVSHSPTGMALSRTFLLHSLSCSPHVFSVCVCVCVTCIHLVVFMSAVIRDQDETGWQQTRFRLQLSRLVMFGSPRCQRWRTRKWAP